ncbi:MAG: endonuclease/exonuclease/phosphatase family protein [Promethearchaeota archaeon]
MNKNTKFLEKLEKVNVELIILSILFLFFFQMITELISAIYMLDLLNTSIDEKAAGILFLFTSIFLIFGKKDVSINVIKIFGGISMIARIILPFTTTFGTMVVAGIGVGSFMLFFPGYLRFKTLKGQKTNGFNFGLSLAIATGLSILFRTLNSSVDISMHGWYQIIGVILALIAGLLLFFFDRLPADTSTPPETNEMDHEKYEKQEEEKTKLRTSDKILNKIKILGLIFGIINIFLLIYFAFESPTVISRWTEGNYLSIIIILALMITSFILVVIFRPKWIRQLKIWMLWLWNVLFALSLIFTIVVHTIKFPATNTSPVVLVQSPPYWYQQIPLYLMLFLSPIIFLDFFLILKELIKLQPSKRILSVGFTLGGLYITIQVFIIVFTNIWGYVGDISLIFRNKFWFPFLLIGIGIIAALPFLNRSLLKFFTNNLNNEINNKHNIKSRKNNISITIFMLLILFGTILGGSLSAMKPAQLTGDGEGIHSLTIMTFNIQMGVNRSGNKNYDSQLKLIKDINPDIIGLQESDSSKPGGGNSDVVRYFADKLGYYSYYGPKKVTGTYGNAILSRYPITNALTFFSYSDEDEIGTAQVQIKVGSEIINVFNSHPAGSADAKLAHIQAVMSRVNGLSNVISMGDFNSRENSTYYNASTAVLVDSFLAIHPNHFDENNVNQTRRIDHIFVSPEFSISGSYFISSPESQTDHPVYWTIINF